MQYDKTVNEKKNTKRKNGKPHKKRKGKNKKKKYINLIYANPQGITGKITSLIAIAQATDAKIIALAETKLNKTTPLVSGYSWINKPRRSDGGGVAFLIRNDIEKNIEKIENLEDHDQEILWIRLNTHGTKTSIGIFYGPQEKSSKEEAERQYAQLTSQISKLKAEGEIILMGDFNAKVTVQKNQINQKETRNGTFLNTMTEDTDTKITSLNANHGTWTRVNRKNTTERSIIDYVIMTEGVANNTKSITIDEIGTHRLKGKEESDHNTIVIETEMTTTNTTSTRKIMNLKDKGGWEKFNKVFETKCQNKMPSTYDEYEEYIKDTMQETLQTITIKEGVYRPKLTEKAKELKKERYRKRKEFEKADQNNKTKTLEEYIKAQKDVRNELENIERTRVEQRIKLIIKEGGAKSDHFWKIRRKILSQGKNENYDLVTEEGEKITDPETTKEYIANFYENLYQAREGTKDYEQWTEHIKKTVNKIEAEANNLPDEPDFTEKEVKQVVKYMKRGKSPGPDGIPNEIFTESNRINLKTHAIIMNNIKNTTEIPKQWTEGHLKRLYKGKGTKGKCSCERGITLASNVGKLFERLINNRVGPEIQMTDAQAGGMKGRATVDHILILKELAYITKQKKQQLILTYLDVTKAYDKAWLDAIMYVLHKRGIKTKLWTLIKKLNTNLTTVIHTKHGPTREIKITDSIRQGGVLSGNMYALLMDETSKALAESELGIEIPNTKTKIPCLLWMDDVVLAETTPKRSQQLLDITNDTSLKYHVEYGMPKTNYLRIGGKKDPVEMKLGQNTLKETEKYTYLGEINNNKMNLKDQIQAIGRKVEAAYQTIIAVTGDREFRGIKMASIWTLVNTCIVPIITYGSETWVTTKTEKKNLNQILDKIIRRILMTPGSTPREALYIETGLLDIETTADSKRLNMKARLNRDKSNMMNEVLKNPKCQWANITSEIMKAYELNDQHLTGPKSQTKTTIKNKVQKLFKEILLNNAKDK